LLKKKKKKSKKESPLTNHSKHQQNEPGQPALQQGQKVQCVINGHLVFIGQAFAAAGQGLFHGAPVAAHHVRVTITTVVDPFYSFGESGLDQGPDDPLLRPARGAFVVIHESALRVHVPSLQVTSSPSSALVLSTAMAAEAAEKTTSEAQKASKTAKTAAAAAAAEATAIATATAAEKAAAAASSTATASTTTPSCSTVCYQRRP
jgi:hypothetical protein